MLIGRHYQLGEEIEMAFHAILFVSTPANSLEFANAISCRPDPRPFSPSPPLLGIPYWGNLFSELRIVPHGSPYRT